MGCEIMEACSMCRRVTFVSLSMRNELGTGNEMVGSILPIPSGFGRLVAWHDGPCVECIR